MKNRVLYIIIILFLCATTACTVQSVADRPVDVVYTRPVAPGDGYVWIDGDWFWSGGRYVWHEGHWDRPRAGHSWVAGS